MRNIIKNYFTDLLFSVIILLLKQLYALFDLIFEATLTGLPFIVRSDQIDSYIKLLNLY